MKKTYTITHDKFLEAKKLITENGGTIYADGSFKVQGVEGRFRFEGDVLEVVIIEKPWLASWGMIEDKLDEFFN